MERFIRSFDAFMGGLVEEAKIRTQRRHSSFRDYLQLRNNTVGSDPTFALCEFALDLPEEVHYHPQMVALRKQGTYLIAIPNVGYQRFGPHE